MPVEEIFDKGTDLWTASVTIPEAVNFPILVKLDYRYLLRSLKLS